MNGQCARPETRGGRARPLLLAHPQERGECLERLIGVVPLHRTEAVAEIVQMRPAARVNGHVRPYRVIPKEWLIVERLAARRAHVNAGRGGGGYQSARAEYARGKFRVFRANAST
jgi:hypothetical protein